MSESKPLVPPDIQIREAQDPARTLKERWLRRVHEAIARGGYAAAEPLLSSAFDDMMIDELTLLFNPRSFYMILNQIIIPKMRREKTEMFGAVVYMDIDRFKKVNEMFGHAGGNDILRVFARILKSKFRTYDVIGRLGGDEFVIIADGLSVSSVEERMNAVRTEFAHYPWKLERIDGGDVSVRHMFSFTFKVEEITSPEMMVKLVDSADRLMMQEKNRRVGSSDRRY